MAKPTATKLGATGTLELPEAVFGSRFHEAVVHEAVQAELSARRSGNASTKTRAQVRGGGAKPWRQKGTGRARIGSIRAPHWTGGGVVFGPSPRSYTVKVNRKARRQALKSALSMHAERGTLGVIDVSSFDAPSTKKAAEILKKWSSPPSVLVLCGPEEESFAKSFRNIATVAISEASNASVADIIRAHSLVVTAAAVESLVEIAGDASVNNKATSPAGAEKKGDQ